MNIFKRIPFFNKHLPKVCNANQVEMEDGNSLESAINNINANLPSDKYVVTINTNTASIQGFTKELYDNILANKVKNSDIECYVNNINSIVVSVFNNNNFATINILQIVGNAKQIITISKQLTTPPYQEEFSFANL